MIKQQSFDEIYDKVKIQNRILDFIIDLTALEEIVDELIECKDLDQLYNLQEKARKIRNVGSH